MGDVYLTIDGDGVINLEVSDYIPSIPTGIFYLDPLTTGPGLAAPAGVYADFTAIISAKPVAGFYEVLDNLTDYMYSDGFGDYYYLAKERLALPPYIAGSSGETRIICLGQFNDLLSFIRLPTIDDPVAQTIAEDSRIEIDGGMAGKVFIWSYAWSSCSFRALWSDPDNVTYGDPYGHIMAINRHIQYEFYCNAREIGARTAAHWTPVGFHGLLMSSDNADGWGNDAERSSNGFLQRFTLDESQFNRLNSEVGKTTIHTWPLVLQPVSGVIDVMGGSPANLMNQTIINTVDMDGGGNEALGFVVADDFAIGARLRFVSAGAVSLIQLPVGHTINGGAEIAISAAGPWGKPFYASDRIMFRLGDSSDGDTVEFQKLAGNIWAWSMFDFVSYTTGTLPWNIIDKTGSQLNELSDVEAPAPNDGEVLTWNVATGRWINAVGGTGGTSDHTALANIGTNTHAQIDTALSTLATNSHAAGSDNQDLSGKQDVLISGTNIKTVNGASILGAGDLVVAGVSGSDIDWSNPVAITGAATLTIGKHHVCSGTTTDYTVTLPPVAGMAGKLLSIMMDGPLTKLVTVDGSSSEMIDGQLTRVMWARESCVLLCNGSGWTKIAGKSIPMNAGLYLSAAQVTGVPFNTATKVPINAALYTNLVPGMADSTNKKIIIIRANPYQVDFGVQWFNTTANGNVNCYLYKDGLFLFNHLVYTLAGAYPDVPASLPAHSCAVGAYFELYGIHAFASANTIHNSTQTFLSCKEILSW